MRIETLEETYVAYVGESIVQSLCQCKMDVASTDVFLLKYCHDMMTISDQHVIQVKMTGHWKPFSYGREERRLLTWSTSMELQQIVMAEQDIMSALYSVLEQKDGIMATFTSQFWLHHWPITCPEWWWIRNEKEEDSVPCIKHQHHSYYTISTCWSVDEEIRMNSKRKREDNVILNLETESPLLRLKSYHPQTQHVDNVISSRTYTNRIDPMKELCRYELGGACHDESCPHQHAQDYTVSQNEALSRIHKKTTTVNTGVLITTNENMNAVLSYLRLLRDNVKKVPWMKIPVQMMSAVASSHPDLVHCFESIDVKKDTTGVTPTIPTTTSTEQVVQDGFVPLSLDSDLESDDETADRYFTNNIIIQSPFDMEVRVEKNPDDIEAWILWTLLVLDPMRKDHTLTSMSFLHVQPHWQLDHALHILSRALEVNAEWEAIWILYLTLYKLRPMVTSFELSELYDQAVLLLPTSLRLWTLYIDHLQKETIITTSSLDTTYQRAVHLQQTSHHFMYLLHSWLSFANASQGYDVVKNAFERIVHHVDKGDKQGPAMILYLHYVTLRVICPLSQLDNTWSNKDLRKATCIDESLWSEALLFLSVLSCDKWIIIALRHYFALTFYFSKNVHEDLLRLQQTWLVQPRFCKPVLINVLITGCSTHHCEEMAMQLLDTTTYVLQSSHTDHMEGRFYWLQHHIHLNRSGEESLQLPLNIFLETCSTWLKDIVHQSSVDISETEVAQVLNRWIVDNKQKVPCDPFFPLVIILLTSVLFTPKRASLLMDKILRHRPVRGDLLEMYWKIQLELIMQHMTWKEFLTYMMEDCLDVLFQRHPIVETTSNMVDILLELVPLQTKHNDSNCSIAVRIVALLMDIVPSTSPDELSLLYGTILERYSYHTSCLFMDYVEWYTKQYGERPPNALLQRYISRIPLPFSQHSSSYFEFRLSLFLSSGHVVKAMRYLSACLYETPHSMAIWRCILRLEIVIGPYRKKLQVEYVQYLTLIMETFGISMTYALEEEKSSLWTQQGWMHLPTTIRLCPWQSLMEIDLSGNALLLLPPRVFTGCGVLKTLNVSYNSLLLLPNSIGELTQLETLNVAHNQLQHLPETLSYCTVLTELNANANLLSSLPTSLQQCTQLKKVYLAFNNLLRRHVESIVPKECELNLQGNLVQASNSNSSLKRRIPMHRDLGPCSLCKRGAGRTQYFNTIIVCSECIISALRTEL